MSHHFFENDEFQFLGSLFPSSIFSLIIYYFPGFFKARIYPTSMAAITRMFKTKSPAGMITNKIFIRFLNFTKTAVSKAAEML
ncbi:MAG TPA: hypothetical protein DD618_02860 [Acholeplasmatales bacterium]|nr:hypothetical protein [Acholeplasmatales bacterium]